MQIGRVILLDVTHLTQQSKNHFSSLPKNLDLLLTMDLTDENTSQTLYLTSAHETKVHGHLAHKVVQKKTPHQTSARLQTLSISPPHNHKSMTVRNQTPENPTKEEAFYIHQFHIANWLEESWCGLSNIF